METLIVKTNDMTKEEILEKYGIIPDCRCDACNEIMKRHTDCMQEYADQETAKLREELAELKAKHKEDVISGILEFAETLGWDKESLNDWYKDKFETNKSDK